MIHFVTTRDHYYTVESLIHRHGRQTCRHWSYEQLFYTKSVPSGTWVFTDHERLSGSQLRRSAQIATDLQNGGARVLNHPAFVRSRFESLRRFNEAGINQFSVMHCESDPRPSRFPVFIRNSFDHYSYDMKLIYNQNELETEIQKLENQGISLTGKLVIECAGEEFYPGVWARLSSYCVAGKVIAHHMAFDHHWIVKSGFNKEHFESHPNKENFLELEKQFVTKNLYSDILEKAFAIARIDYGRADCSIVENQLQIYEINTNPHHGFEHQVLEETHPQRRSIQKQSEDELQEAIVNLNTVAGDNIIIGELWLKSVARVGWHTIKRTIS